MTTAQTADEVRAQLEIGAAAAGYPYLRAAIHLINFTDLPDRAAFGDHLEIDTVTLDGREVPAAFIRDWNALSRLDTLGHLHSSAARLVGLAASLAHGTPVDLRTALTELGHAHARRVLEALAICLDDDYEITPTPALLERQRVLEELFADTPGSDTAAAPTAQDRG